MNLPDDFTAKLEGQLRAGLAASAAADRPLFGPSVDAPVGPTAKAREDRALNRVAAAGLEPWRVLSIHEAAKFAGVASGMLQRMHNSGDGPPCIKVAGEDFLFAAGELAYWLENAMDEAKG